MYVWYRAYSTILYTQPFCLCFTTHIPFSADHGGRRLGPIPSPGKRKVVTPTSGGMMPALSFVSYHWGRELLVTPPPHDAFVGSSFLARKFIYNTKNSPHTPTYSFSVSMYLLLWPLFLYFSGFYLYYRHTPTSKEVAQPLFVCHPLKITTFYLPVLFFWWDPIYVVRQICQIRIKIFSKASFFNFSLPHT